MSLKVNREAFFASFRKHFGRLTQTQVDGANSILDAWEKYGDNDHRKLANVFAQAWHETGSTLGPVPEGGRGRGHEYGKPHPVTGQTYYGRGLVQLTWWENYDKMGRLLGLPLAEQPDLALRQDIAAKIMVRGMMLGAFRPGHNLERYFPTGGAANVIGARLIVNGIPRGETLPDKAKLIQGYHVKFLAVLEDQNVLQALIPVIVGQAIKHGIEALTADKSVPQVTVQNADVIEREINRRVQEALRKEVLPELKHITNQEPWYQSRVTLGAIASILAGFAGLVGWQIGAEDLASVLIAVVPLLGGALSLWGRWAAKKPIGA